MDRDGLMGGKCSTICEIKAELAALQERINGLYTSLNGLQGDGSGNLQIIAGTGVNVDTRSGNEVRISAGIVEMDDVPTAGSDKPVKSGGVYTADQNLQAGISTNADSISTETAARIAADNAESSARIAADNAESAARIAMDEDLDERIDKVIDGTIAPVTISGILPISKGGTGSTDATFSNAITARTPEIVDSTLYPASTQYSKAVQWTDALNRTFASQQVSLSPSASSFITLFSKNTNTNCRLVMNFNANGTMRLSIDKTVNGVFSSQVVGTL